MNVPLLMAGACAAGVLLTYIAAFHMQAAKDVDLGTYFAFVAAVEQQSGSVLDDLVGSVDPHHFAVLAPIAPAIGVVRDRPWLAVAAVVVIGGATLTTEVLKEVTLAHRFQPRGEVIAWPSGHATAATALALALVLVVPERWRASTAVAGMAWVAGIAIAILLLGKHVASDVVAGMLVAGTWAGLTLGALRAWQAPAPADEEPGRWRLVLPVGATAAVAVTAGAIAASLAKDQDGTALDADPLALAGGALVMTGLAVLIVGATALGAPDDSAAARRD